MMIYAVPPLILLLIIGYFVYSIVHADRLAARLGVPTRAAGILLRFVLSVGIAIAGVILAAFVINFSG